MAAPKLPVPIDLADMQGWFGEVLKKLEHLKERTVRKMGPPLGRIQAVFHFIYGIMRIDQMFEKDERPMSVQPHLSLVPSHNVLAVKFENGVPYVALTKRWREGAAEPELYMPAWEKGKVVDPELVYPYLGKEYFEIPRGGLDPDPNGNGLMSAREAAEELGMEVVTVINLGFNNQDAAWVMTAPVVLLAVMGRDDASLMDQHEAASFTKGKTWVPAKDLGLVEWETDDGISQAAFWRAMKRLKRLEPQHFVNPDDWNNEELRNNLAALAEALSN